MLRGIKEKKKFIGLTSEKVRFERRVELNSNLTVVLIVKLFYAFCSLATVDNFTTGKLLYTAHRTNFD